MDGNTLLARWLEHTGTTKRALARVLCVGESTIWAWGQGRTRPLLDTAASLERITEGMVPATAWASQVAVDGAVSRFGEIDSE